MPRWLLLCGVLLMTAEASGQSPQAGYERSGAMRNQSRSVVMAKHGMVATSHPLAAQAGLDVLKAGGTAADAAIATNAMLGVVEPMSCGIGGDLFVIYWDNKTQKLYGLNASGRSPYNLSRKTFADKGMSEIPSSGVLSWSVPGCVDGWEELRAKFGTKTLAQDLRAAIETAEEGFPVSEVIAGSWKSSVPSLRDWADSTATYLIDGARAPAAGEVFRNPRLAKSLRLIAEQGRDAFYKGEIAKEIVSFSEKQGGYFSLKDFADHTSTWIEPVSTNYRGYDVWELPPNGQGIAALQMLNLLEPYDLKKLGHNSAEMLHLLLEAKKLAFADRAKFYADPDFAKLPTAELISKEYARERGKLLDRSKAGIDVPAGSPHLETCDTVYLTVVDKDRNCCSFIQSIFNGFGSQVVPGNVGFAMQNRGCLFALDDKHLNRLEPHKRPFHTIIPAMVTKDGQPWFCYGVMGGDMQAQGHVQILLNIIDFGMNVQAAGDAARVMHTGSADPTGAPANGSGTVHVEAGVSDEAVAVLKAKGHKVFRSRGGYGGYQGILLDREQGTLHGGTEPRKDGAAVGY
ncbi:gamma-glutamyltransferase [Anatilimnocola sp. NA78]|uniref:gamma-glutamyltransferase n=1 Tax=Anatilimnocola sp. NA78 TaxID=3415683 RepID=UPI003CE58DF1